MTETLDFYFPYKTDYKGRNGSGIQLGISIQKRVSTIDFFPINSKGVSNAAMLTIPKTEAQRFIDALKNLVEK